MDSIFQKIKKKFAFDRMKFEPMVFPVLWRFNFTPLAETRARAHSVSPTPPPVRPRERTGSALQLCSNFFVQCLPSRKRLARFAGSPTFFRFESNDFSSVLRSKKPKANFFYP